jgi:hypothetical protein
MTIKVILTHRLMRSGLLEISMRLIAADPDIETLVHRIDDETIDLQPDFQRGAVWPAPKQQRLIDSVLRDWHIPPIHLVRLSDDQQVVLDGQQRLRAIHDFVRGLIRVDGYTDPEDSEIVALDRLRYSQLPRKYKQRFDRFTIRVFEIIDYKPEEPYELFYRLNQPTVLTAAEKRNAFFGPARAQVKELVDEAVELGLGKERVGFSNSRMAYDDVLARFCFTLEVGTLYEQVTSTAITAKYREQEPFKADTIERARESLRTLLDLPTLDSGVVRFNKATFQSWLCFVAALDREKHNGQPVQHLDTFLHWFELSRANVKAGHEAVVKPVEARMILSNAQLDRLLLIFNDRATARVADVLSVLIRDLILWLLFVVDDDRADTIDKRRASELRRFFHDAGSSNLERELSIFIDRNNWGASL